MIGESQELRKGSETHGHGPGGTGLPPIEMFLQRHIIFPGLCATTSFEAALALFEKESSTLISEVGSLAPLVRERRILVPRLPAIEDCSRFWSAAMVLEHLIIAGTGIQNVAQLLAAGRTPGAKVSISAVKPHGELTGEACVDAFMEYSSEFLMTANRLAPAKKSKFSHAHPWFGQLNLHQWICLAAIHQRVHRRQVEAIISRL